jgi:hypothetical protein
MREEDPAQMRAESVAKSASALEARLAASEAVQVAALEEMVRDGGSGGSGGGGGGPGHGDGDPVSSREEMVRGVAGGSVLVDS